jgi:hypothetical protein
MLNYYNKALHKIALCHVTTAVKAHVYFSITKITPIKAHIPKCELCIFNI